MPRYLIEREWPDGPTAAPAEWGAERCREIVDANLEEGVTWVVSYVDRALQRTFCLYEGPTPEAIRAASQRCGLSVKRITEVRVLEPSAPTLRLSLL